jgi:hypothetical protein
VGHLGISVLEAAKVLATADIIIRDDDEHSRVATHEYGHFAMCSLMYKENLRLFSNVNADIVHRTVAGGRDRGDDVLAINEGFADYFASQVAGGINYWASAPGTGHAGRSMWYCDPSSTSCVDDNLGGTPGSEQKVDTTHFDTISFKSAQVSTYMTDAADGDTSNGDTPNNGAAFSLDHGKLVPHTAGGSWSDDEPVALGRHWLGGLVKRLADGRIIGGTGWRLDRKVFFKSLNDQMVAAHYARRVVCDLCELHLNNQFCDAAGFSTFACTTYDLKAKVIGLGKITASNAGRVSDAPMSCTASVGPCVVAYDKGTAVTVRATPAAGQRFVGWSGGVCSGTAATCAVTMSQLRSVTAKFEGIPVTATLTVNVSSGQPEDAIIKSLPAGINCRAAAHGSKTCTMTAVVGTHIKLTASSEVLEQVVWSGLCANVDRFKYTCDFELARDSTVGAHLFRLL